MKRSEYGKIHNLKSEQDWMDHFKHNLLSGHGFASMYSCPHCDKILNNDELYTHNCKKT